MFIRCTSDITVDAQGSPQCPSGWEALTTEQLQSEVDLGALTELVTILNSALSTPSADDIAVAFSAGMFVPLLAYLTASHFGVIINWFKF